jgi:hypothetical protein
MPCNAIIVAGKYTCNGCGIAEKKAMCKDCGYLVKGENGQLVQGARHCGDCFLKNLKPVDAEAKSAEEAKLAQEHELVKEANKKKRKRDNDAENRETYNNIQALALAREGTRTFALVLGKKLVINRNVCTGNDQTQAEVLRANFDQQSLLERDLSLHKKASAPRKGASSLFVKSVKNRWKNGTAPKNKQPSMFKSLERVSKINLKGPSYLIKNRDRPTAASHNLFCVACGTDVAGDCRANVHVTQDGHIKNVVELVKKEAEKTASISRLADTVMAGTTDVASLQERLEFLKDALLSGPLARSERWRLRHNKTPGNRHIPALTHLAKLIPDLAKLEDLKLREQLKGRWVSFYHDGATRVHKIFGLVCRFMDMATLEVLTRAVSLKFYDAVFNASKTAKFINATIVGDLQIKSDLVVAFNNDCVASNILAAETLSVLYDNALMGQCVSHTACHVGEQAKDQKIHDLVHNIAHLGSHASGNKIWHLTHIGTPGLSFTETRWYSEHDVMVILLDKWEVYVQQIPIGYQAGELSGVGAHKLAMQFANSKDMDLMRLRLRMTALVQYSYPLVKMCYVMESNETLSLFYCEITDVTSSSLRVNLAR